jgi:hypothetical protein
MAALTSEQIAIISKLGDSLSQISQPTGPTTEQVNIMLGHPTGLTDEKLSPIFHMKPRGSSLDQISQGVEEELRVLKQSLPQDTPATDDYPTYSHFGSSIPEEFIEPAQVSPLFFYSFKQHTGQLCRTNLLTGEQSCLLVPALQYKLNCRWSEFDGMLLITGGWSGPRTVREVERVDTLREFAVCSQPPMHTARSSHAAVYHSQHLYVLGGYNGMILSDCERYVCAESRWEELPALPVACQAMSAVVLDNSLYALGGNAYRGDLDTVQKLSVLSLTWELMQLKLPQAVHSFPCFKTDTKVYLLIMQTLFSFSVLHVRPIKTVALHDCYVCSSSYYSRGSLYYSSYDGIKSLQVGELA